MGVLTPAANPRFFARVFKAAPVKEYMVFCGVMVVNVLKLLDDDTSMIWLGTETGTFIDASLIVSVLLFQVRASTEEEAISFVKTRLFSLEINSEGSSPETLMSAPSFSHAVKNAEQHIINISILVFIFLFF
jgi:hypothetical protein